MAADSLDSVRVLDRTGAAIAQVAVILPDVEAASAGSRGPWVMDQVNKQFEPHVLIVPQSSLVSFPNSDDTRHHVYSFSDAKTFELRLYHGNEAQPVLFDKTGLVKIGCNIHDNMRAYIVVTEHSVFGTTDSDGFFRWPALKQNLNKIMLWHPQLAEYFIAEVDPNDSGTVTITMPVDTPLQPEQSTPSSLEQRLKQFKRNAQ